MPIYRLRLRLTSPLGTPIVGPTVFGQLCWLRREMEGEASLEAWLGDPERTWRMSDGFPAGYLPRPILAPRPIDRASYARLKEMKKRTLVSRSFWLKLRDGWDDAMLAEADTIADPAMPRRVAHNHVHRSGQGTQEEGGLYFLEEDWRFDAGEGDSGQGPPGDARGHKGKVDLYIETSEGLEVVEWLVAILGQQGFGRDASTGRGRWTVEEALEDREIASNDGPRRMSLSRGALDLATMLDAYWKLETHFGRLGPRLSLSGTSPFKRPVLLTRPGTTFLPGSPGPFGRILEKVHPSRPEVILNGLHIAIPFREAA